MEAKLLIIRLHCELEQGCRAEAAGHPDFCKAISESGTTPDEARGHLLRSLYLGGYLSEPVKIVFENTSDYTSVY